MGQTVGTIKKNYAQLRASERKVANWVLSHAAQVPEMTMAQLAAAAGVSEPTVARFAEAAGFGGFSALKLALAKEAAHAAPQRLLDVATGTGDFALLGARMLRPERLVGVDLSEGMLAVGREKVKRAGLDGVITFRKDDCLHLSMDADTFDAVTVAYGIRNFEDLDQGLREMCRVLRPGGRLAIIELCTPVRFPMKQLFRLYSRVLMPAVGRLVSRDGRAYRYLPATMEAFPQGEVMQGILERAGFREVRFRRFTFGLSTLYTATK